MSVTSRSSRSARALRRLIAALTIAAPVATAAAHEVRFENLTGTTIRALYVAPSQLGDWGEDQLGKYMIDAGESFTLDLGIQSAPCPFDVKAVFVDDDEAMSFAVDLCSIDVFYFRPEG